MAEEPKKPEIMMSNTIPILSLFGGLVALLLSVDIQLWGNVEPITTLYVSVGATILSLTTLVIISNLRWLSAVVFVGSLFMFVINFIAAAGGL